jgi:alkylated DNA repair protein (DNA oxidative demethylase)
MRRRSIRATEPPPGLIYEPEFISRVDEETLLTRFDSLSFNKVEMRGFIARREVIHYGWDYLYDEWKIEPTLPLPSFLEPLRANVAARIGVEPESLAEVLVSKYPPGAGIGWHRDAPMFGETVAGVSVGSRCVLRFRRMSKEEIVTWKQEVASRSLYLLEGAARRIWQHSIDSTPELRYSITFRTLRG